MTKNERLIDIKQIIDDIYNILQKIINENTLPNIKLSENVEERKCHEYWIRFNTTNYCQYNIKIVHTHGPPIHFELYKVNKYGAITTLYDIPFNTINNLDIEDILCYYQEEVEKVIYDMLNIIVEEDLIK